MPFELPVAELERAEKVLGARFPDSYREAMIRRNGGEIEAAKETWELIPIRDDSCRERLYRTCNDMLAETDQFRSWRSWPKFGIAIARNGVGDALVLLQQAGEIPPEVYVWWHETGVVEVVADDFGDLPSA